MWSTADTRPPTTDEWMVLHKVGVRRARQVGLIVGLLVAIPAATAASVIGFSLAAATAIGGGVVLSSWALSAGPISNVIRRKDPVSRRIEQCIDRAESTVPADFFPSVAHVWRKPARVLRHLTGWGGIGAAASMLLGGSTDSPSQRLGLRLGVLLGLAGVTFGLLGLPVASSPILAANVLEVAAAAAVVGSWVGGEVAEGIAMARASAEIGGWKAGVRAYFGHLGVYSESRMATLQINDQRNRRVLVGWLGAVLVGATVWGTRALAPYLMPHKGPVVRPGDGPKLEALPDDEPSLTETGWATSGPPARRRGKVAATFHISTATEAQAEAEHAGFDGASTAVRKRLMRVDLRTGSGAVVALAIEQSLTGTRLVIIAGQARASAVGTWTDADDQPVDVAVGDDVHLEIVNRGDGFFDLSVTNLRSGRSGVLHMDAAAVLDGEETTAAHIVVGRALADGGTEWSPFLDTATTGVTDMHIDGTPVGNVEDIRSLRLVAPWAGDVLAEAPVLASVSPLDDRGQACEVVSYPIPMVPVQVPTAGDQPPRRLVLLGLAGLVNPGQLVREAQRCLTPPLPPKGTGASGRPGMTPRRPAAVTAPDRPRGTRTP